ncbi:MAG: hypothetical protein AB7G11_01225 [Phycisphaerales bacterium]
MKDRKDRANRKGARRVRAGCRRGVAGLLIACSLGWGTGGAWGQVSVPIVEDRPQPTAMRAPRLSGAVKRVLEADYQTEESAREARLFHGLWKASDLNTPQRIAAAALMCGALDEPALQLPEVSLVDRAEAAMLRGEVRDAISMLEISRRQVEADGKRPTARAGRIAAQAHDLLGEFDEAVRIAEQTSRAVTEARSTEPDEIVEAVRALGIAARIKGPAAPGSGADYQALMQTLDRVINQLNRLYWPARLAQAELLYAKDNPGEAGKALQEVLSLNPSCAAAWALLGQMSVDAYNFEQMEGIAGRLDLLGSGRGGDHDEAEGEEGSGNGGVSIYAGIVRARAAVRQGEPDAGEAALRPLLDRYPRCRDGLAARCAVEAIRYDQGATDRMLAGFDELSPGSGLAMLAVARALSEARQYAMAAPYFEKAHAREPRWAEPLIDLGLMEVQWGRIEKALPALEEAVALDPFNLRADNTLKLVRELLTYATIRSEHFVVRYKPGDDEVLARDMPGPLEEMYRVVTGDEPGGMDHEPRQITYIDLMPDHRWFGVRIAGMPAIHTIAASTGSCIAMEAPREGKGHLGPYDWIRVLRHEFTHTVGLDRTNNRIPHWFTEAQAVYLELSPRDYSTCQLLARALKTETLFDFSEINSAFVRPKRATDRAQAYAQGHWMYEYIIRTWGKKAPLDLMDLYAQGQREEAAYQSVLGISRDEFLSRFKAWAQGQVIEWGLALPAGVPSVKDLLVEEAARQEAAAAEAQARKRLAELSPSKDAARVNEADGHEGAPRAADRVAEVIRDLAGALQDAAQEHDRELPEPDKQMVSRWLEAHPAHPDVLELAVRIELADAPNQSATPGMAPLLERYAQARPVDPLPHQQLAKLYLSDPATAPRAIEHLEWLDAREQKTSAYAAELAKRYAAAGDWDKARAKAERATQVAPYDAGNRELAATVAIRRKDYDAAERHLSAVAMLEPSVELHKQRLEALKRLRSGN